MDNVQVTLNEGAGITSGKADKPAPTLGGSNSPVLKFH